MTSSARKDLLHPSWEIFWDPGGLWPRSRVRVAAAFVVSLWEGCTDGSVGRQRRGLSHSSTWSERPVPRLGSLCQSPGLLCQSSFSYSPCTDSLFASPQLSTGSQPYPQFANPSAKWEAWPDSSLCPQGLPPLEVPGFLQPSSSDLRSPPRPPGA